ncbi:MAG: GxxExxY protein [Deltaproteobacteria bacterium]|nr:MAG: GxxExxY protein [Deltaproteobacteria bacterium]
MCSKIIGAAIEVHRHVGPGLLERAYAVCLTHELRQLGLDVRTEVTMPLVYKGVALDHAYRLDLLVDGAVIVEVKAVKALQPIHTAQLISYLRLSGLTVGLLLNFHVPLLRTGIKRLVV